MRGFGTPPPANTIRTLSNQRNMTITGDEKERDSGRNGVNVKVIVRCRPLSELEKKDPSQFHVVSTKVEAKEVFVSQTIPGRKVESYSKTFTFDGVCNQFTTQHELFNTYIIPIVDEVLQGFNCTIFAYGQTGTGKTYTMEGDVYQKSIAAQRGGVMPSDPTLARLSSCTSTSIGSSCLTEQAGIIPRAVQHIFERLEAQDTEYSVRVSYLEIYNEELNDLLNDGEKQNLRIFEDSGGKKGLSVDRLEEIPVNNPQDIFNILSIAVKKRRTAETLLNRQSSRSHCIFSVMIHMKETNIEGEDVIKIGKLNLVDLAGSENIQRSGANTIKDRAKEAGMINQSLLTLGRVINALVEHSSYVPYRDSKLTRLLQESLGGRTKTCIVATISPSSLCLEETLSTLDYAFRAKNIRNRPEINQKMTKRVMIRELNQEIEKLKIELQANREKNGVYLPLDRYAEIEARLFSQSAELTDATAEIGKAKNELATSQAEKGKLMEELKSEIFAHIESRKTLESTLSELTNLRIELQTATTELEKESMVTSRLRAAEFSLHSRCLQLMEFVIQMINHVELLREKLASCREIGRRECGLLDHISDRGLELRESMKTALDQWQANFVHDITRISENVIPEVKKTTKSSEESIRNLVEVIHTSAKENLAKFDKLWQSYEAAITNFDSQLCAIVTSHVQKTDQDNGVMMQKTEFDLTKMQDELKNLAEVVSDFSNTMGSSTMSNKRNFQQLITDVSNRFSTFGKTISEGFRETDNTLSLLATKLTEFKEQQSQGLENSMRSIRRQIELILSKFMEQNQEKLNLEITQLLSSCASSQICIQSLRNVSSEYITRDFPPELNRLQNDVDTNLDQCNMYMQQLVDQHSVVTQKVSSNMENTKEILTRWGLAQESDSKTLLEDALPNLLSEQSKTLSGLQINAIEQNRVYERIIQQQSNEINLSLSDESRLLLNHVRLIENELLTLKDSTQSHSASLDVSLEHLEGTITSSQKCTSNLLSDMEPANNTPRPIEPPLDLQARPQLLPPRDVLLEEFVSKELPDIDERTKITEDPLKLLSSQSSSGYSTIIDSPSVPSSTDVFHHSTISSDQPALQRPVLPPPNRFVPRTASFSTSRSADGSSRRSSSLTRKRKDIPSFHTTNDSLAARRASSGSQVILCSYSSNIHRSPFLKQNSNIPIVALASDSSLVSPNSYATKDNQNSVNEGEADEGDPSVVASPERQWQSDKDCKIFNMSKDTSGSSLTGRNSIESNISESKENIKHVSARSSAGDKNREVKSDEIAVDQGNERRSSTRAVDRTINIRRKHPSQSEPEYKRRRAISKDSKRG